MSFQERLQKLLESQRIARLKAEALKRQQETEEQKRQRKYQEMVSRLEKIVRDEFAPLLKTVNSVYLRRRGKIEISTWAGSTVTCSLVWDRTDYGLGSYGYHHIEIDINLNNNIGSTGSQGVDSVG